MKKDSIIRESAKRKKKHYIFVSDGEKKPIILFVLPVLMVLILLLGIYLAYRELQEDTDQTTSSMVTSMSVAARKDAAREGIGMA